MSKKENRSMLYHFLFWTVYLSIEILLIRPFVGWVYAGGGMGSGTFFAGMRMFLLCDFASMVWRIALGIYFAGGFKNIKGMPTTGLLIAALACVAIYWLKYGFYSVIGGFLKPLWRYGQLDMAAVACGYLFVTAFRKQSDSRKPDAT